MPHELVEAITAGRVWPIILDLELGESGSCRVSFEKVDTSRGTMDFEHPHRGYVSDFPCEAITAVTRVDHEGPVDHSDELRAV